jgi:signal transduction histidine kinase/DNA-binding NarL/FixJ family response regulator/tetratricopeptide (TPR) repeat protein
MLTVRCILVFWPLVGSLAAQPAPANNVPAGTVLPASRARLLAPPLDNPRQDMARLRAARAQWAGDSLGRLLVYNRLGADFHRLQQFDSALYYMRRAWRQAGPTQRRQQPDEVVGLANGLANYYHVRGKYDSAIVYYQHAIAAFKQAGLDSSRGAQPGTLLASSHEPWGGGWALCSSLGNVGSALRQNGDLPRALRYYERARALYEQQHDLPGVIWTQSLVGEAYAEQGDLPQALLAYEQALRTAQRYQRRNAEESSHIQADLALDYYAPLLLAVPGHQGQAGRVAAEAIHALHAAFPDSMLRAKPYDGALLARLHLVLAEEALRAGPPAAAAPYLRKAGQWLAYARPASREPYYRRALTLLLGLRAWQLHATSPATSRRLLAQATALLTVVPADNALARLGPQLAGYCLGMGEPALAQQVLWPLLHQNGQRLSPAGCSQATTLLAQAYARMGRYDSAYAYACHAQALADTLRAAQQFAAVAATEARFRTREQAAQIRLLTERDQQQTVRVRLAAAGAALLALLLLGAGAAWRTTRRLNGRLATQSTRLQVQAERLGKLDAAKNQFFANVSHELRTPLTLVLGPLDGLLHTPRAPLPEAVRGPVALAHRSAQRLLELVNRILDLTKLEAGRLELQPVPTALATLLRRVVAQFDSLAAERRVALVAPAALPEGLRLLLDADKIEQILTNLLINALNHTPAGGAVVVSAALPAPNGQYELTVRDTGPGIAASEQARVFERFYQSPQRQAQGGTGLGLALSRELATLLGGTLTLASSPGQGAAFTLRFPATELRVEREELRVRSTDKGGYSEEAGLGEAGAAIDADITAEPLAPTTPSLSLNSQLLTLDSKPRVLVVEDQPDLRNYLRTLLVPAYEVLTATDGQDALDVMAREAPVDLLITDAMMPHLSGTELLARLKANPARAGLPVLMLTARADDAHRQAALTVGVDDYLTKPFLTNELLARVQALLVRHAVRRQFAALPAEVATAAAITAAPAAPTAATPTATPSLGEAAPAPASPATAGQLAQWQAQLAPQLPNPEFGPAELASLLNMSERTLYRRLGELAGLTPAAWLRELRLDHARRLLEAGGFGSVAAVAEAAGFGNAKAFAARYTERFGRRPGDYGR